MLISNDKGIVCKMNQRVRCVKHPCAYISVVCARALRVDACAHASARTRMNAHGCFTPQIALIPFAYDPLNMRDRHAKGIRAIEGGDVHARICSSSWTTFRGGRQCKCRPLDSTSFGKHAQKKADPKSKFKTVKYQDFQWVTCGSSLVRGHHSCLDL